MKKFISLFAIAVMFALTTVSCSKDDLGSEPPVNLPEPDVVYPVNPIEGPIPY